MIILKDITKDNWKECIKLKVYDNEKEYIATNVYSIAEVQFYPKVESKAIYDDEQMVGYTMYGEDEDDRQMYFIDRLMVSKEHRKKGYAFDTLTRIIKKAKEGGYKIVRCRAYSLK